jgi:hypothetical protein
LDQLIGVVSPPVNALSLLIAAIRVRLGERQARGGLLAEPLHELHGVQVALEGQVVVGPFRFVAAHRPQVLLHGRVPAGELGR